MRKVLIDHGGYDDSNIVLMIAGDIPCDPRSVTGRGSILRDGVDLLNSSGGGGDDDGIFTALSSTIDYAGDDGMWKICCSFCTKYHTIAVFISQFFLLLPFDHFHHTSFISSYCCEFS